MTELAIVVPAYKPSFLRAALESLASQSDRRFHVYVGDDAGPPEIAAICSDLRAEGLPLFYTRFDENLGGRSLTAHWNRCVELSTEPWVWLFADDDVMEPDCVHSFYDALTDGVEEHVLRFDTLVIDSQGKTLLENVPHPRIETGVDFLYARLLGERHSYVVEYVFRRQTFDGVGGFPEYPAAWCADDAAWFLFSRGSCIRTLSGARVKWRASGLNITDANHALQREKLAAAAQFLRFVDREVLPADTGSRAVADWRAASERWYVDQIRYLSPIPPTLWREVLSASRGTWRVGNVRKLLDLARWGSAAAARTLRTALLRRLSGAPRETAHS